MFLSEWREFPSAPCLAGKKNLMTARVSVLLKWRASLTCYRACIFPSGAKDLSAHRCDFASNCLNSMYMASLTPSLHLRIITFVGLTWGC